MNRLYSGEPEHPFVKQPNRTLLSLAFPVLFSLIAEPLTGLADTAFVVRLSGSEPAAALGVGVVAFSSIFWAFSFLGVGTQTEVSKGLGRGDDAYVVRVVSLAILLSVCIGGALMLLAIAFLSEIAVVFGAEGLLRI